MLRVVEEVHGDQTPANDLFVARQLGGAVGLERGLQLGRRGTATTASQSDPFKHGGWGPFSATVGRSFDLYTGGERGMAH